MTYKFIWYADKRPEIIEKEKKLGYKYYLAMNYKMFPEIQNEFNPKDFKKTFNLPLVDKMLDKNIYELSCQTTIPLGDLESDFIFQSIPSLNDDTQDPQIKKITIASEKQRITEERNPKPLSNLEIQKILKEKQKITINNPRNEEKQFTIEQGLQSLCPFNIENLWHILLYNELFQYNKITNLVNLIISLNKYQIKQEQFYKKI